MTGKWLGRSLVLAFVAWMAKTWLEQGRGVEGPVEERRAEPDTDALVSATEGDRIGVDLEKLRDIQSAAYKPLVEYLSYIQVQRGENQSLVFVRRRDLDSLAALTGGSKDEFVEEFKQLGVLLSMN